MLDPPLSTFLDEVANSTPVPLDHWAADSLSWGITVTAVVQDLGQLRARWSAERAQTIFSNLPTEVVLPGVAIRDDLEDLAYLAGQRTIRQTSEHHGATGERKPRSRTISRVREAVIPGRVIYRLPRRHAYVLGLGPRPAVARFTPGYRIVQRQARTAIIGPDNRAPTACRRRPKRARPRQWSTSTHGRMSRRPRRDVRTSRPARRTA